MPLDLLGLGAAASGIGSIAGGLLGASSAKKSQKEAKRQFNLQLNESVQRRVADAKAAGIHPLFALGASVGASPTMHAGQSDTGSMVGEAISGAGRAATNYAQAKGLSAVQAAQIRSAEANATRDEAEAQLALSRSKRLEQDMTSRGHDSLSYPEKEGLVTFPLPNQDPIGVPIVTPKGKRQVAGERQLAATPTDNIYKLPFGFRLRTAGKYSSMEALEQHYGDVGSAPWQVAAFIQDSLEGRISNPKLEAWLKKAGSAGRRWFEKELWKIEVRMNQKRRKK